MTLIEKTGLSIAAGLWAAAAASCADPAAPSAAYQQATAADAPSLPKGGVPIRALPSHVVMGEVAVFKVDPAAAGAPKTADPGAPLPSRITVGRTAVYTPQRQEAGGVGDESRERGAPAPGPEP